MAKVVDDDDPYGLTNKELAEELTRPVESWNERVLREAIRRILVRLINEHHNKNS